MRDYGDSAVFAIPCGEPAACFCHPDQQWRPPLDKSDGECGEAMSTAVGFAQPVTKKSFTHAPVSPRPATRERGCYSNCQLGLNMCARPEIFAWNSENVMFANVREVVFSLQHIILCSFSSVAPAAECASRLQLSAAESLFGPPLPAEN